MTTTEQQIEKIDREIEHHREQIRVYEAQKEAVVQEAASPYREIAVLLHRAECSWNHTDGCGWEYETGWDAKPANGMTTWTGHAHKRWLETAIKRVAASGVTPEEFVTALEIVGKKA